MNRDVLFSRRSDHWSTPAETYDALHAEFGFTFDPCPLRSDCDGLAIAWAGRVFCNPPYSKIAAFLRKGLDAIATGTCEVIVYLVPARTDTAWFHDHVLGKAEIRFLRGRLKFGGLKKDAPFPSMLAVYTQSLGDAKPNET